MADTSATRSSAIDPTILNQAADWLVLLQSGEATEQDLAKLSQWRQQSPAHEAAWQRAESVLGTFRQVPPQVGQDTLARLPRHVRHFDNYTQVSVLEGAVQARPAQSSQTTTVPAGQQLRFTTTELHTPQAADATSSLWTNGMLLAQDMRLGDLIAELARYQRGLLRCDPEVAQLLVSGSFPVNDIAASLRVLEKSLPVRIARPAPYWITVKAR